MNLVINNYNYEGRDSIIINLANYDEIYTSNYKYTSDYRYYIIISYIGRSEKKLYFETVEQRDEVFNDIISKVGANVLSIK